jgi:hypothetical protein
MSAFDPKRTSRNLDTTQRPTGSRCVWATKPSVPRRPAALRVRRTQLSMSATGTEAGRAQLLLVVPENVSELWPRHTSSPGFFLGKQMRAADTSLTRPKKHSPKSFRSPVGIVKKEPCGVHCLHGQRECIDCGSAGYGLQKFSVIAPQRSAVRCNDPGAPFSRFLLERGNLKPLVLHSSTTLRLHNGTQR